MDIVYRRTPLPRPLRISSWLTLLIWMLVIAAPFVAFTVNGRVDGSNWTPAFIVMGVAAALYLAKAIWVGMVWRGLPGEIRDEYSKGRMIAPETAARSAPENVPFGELRASSIEAGLAGQGVWFGLSALKSASPQRRRLFAGQGRRHELAWGEIAEWQVHDDMDSDAYYHLVCEDGSWVRLPRPTDRRAERRILDAVRRAGCPVRLFCDVE